MSRRDNISTLRSSDWRSNDDPFSSTIAVRRYKEIIETQGASSRVAVQWRVHEAQGAGYIVLLRTADHCMVVRVA
jgi:hypothetical protein